MQTAAVTDPADDEQEHEPETVADVERTPHEPHAATLSEGPGFRTDLEQYAAERAEKYLDKAIDALASTLEKPTRYAKDRNAAAMNLINLALRRLPQAQGQVSAKVVLLDPAKAAAVLAKRLGLPE